MVRQRGREQIRLLTAARTVTDTGSNLEAWNDHESEAIVEFRSTDCEQLSRLELREIAESWFAASPDLTRGIEELAVDGGWVLARFTFPGTHQGSYWGVAPTGNEIEVADHATVRFENERIVEIHATADTPTLLQQLGVRMPPGETRANDDALARQSFGALDDRNRKAFVPPMADDFAYGGTEGPEEMADSDWRPLETMNLTRDCRRYTQKTSHHPRRGTRNAPRREIRARANPGVVRNHRDVAEPDRERIDR